MLRMYGRFERRLPLTATFTVPLNPCVFPCSLSVCVCVCVCVCAHARARACVCVCVCMIHACMDRVSKPKRIQVLNTQVLSLVHSIKAANKDKDRRQTRTERTGKEARPDNRRRGVSNEAAYCKAATQPPHLEREVLAGTSVTG